MFQKTLFLISIIKMWEKSNVGWFLSFDYSKLQFNASNFDIPHEIKKNNEQQMKWLSFYQRSNPWFLPGFYLVYFSIFFLLFKVFLCIWNDLKSNKQSVVDLIFWRKYVRTKLLTFLEITVLLTQKICHCWSDQFSQGQR